MNKDKLVVGVLIEATHTYSFIEVCHRYHIPEALLQEMLEEGLFSAQHTEKHHMLIDQKALQRIESALRLHNDLGINMPGAALTLDLLEKIEKMQKELDILRKQFYLE